MFKGRVSRPYIFSDKKIEEERFLFCSSSENNFNQVLCVFYSLQGVMLIS